MIDLIKKWLKSKIPGNKSNHYDLTALDLPQDLIFFPYEILNDKKSIENANKILLSGWKLGHYPVVRLNEIPWQYQTDNERSWNYHIHCWDMVESLLQTHSATLEPPYLIAAIEVAVEWVKTQSDADSPKLSPYAWYDMAVGLRAYRLAYILDAGKKLNLLDEKNQDLLLKSLEEHRSYLTNDKHIAFHSNHGFYQIAGQLAMSRRFAYLSDSMLKSYLQAIDRLQFILNKQFSKEGVHLEHSPDYHRMVYRTLKCMLDAGLITGRNLHELCENIEEALAWFVLPNRNICNFGDSDYKSLGENPETAAQLWMTPHMRYATTGGKAGALPEAHYRFFKSSGYFIVRKPSDQHPNIGSDDSYLAVNAAYHSRTHKHADDLSFVWSEGSNDILVDAGRYGYIGKTVKGSPLYNAGFWYSDPQRIFCESTHAHNTLEFDGQSYPRRKITKPYGSALRKFSSINDKIFSVSAEVKQFSTTVHKRVLIFNPACWLLVWDRFDNLSQRTHSVKQWFHLSPHLQCIQNANGFNINLDIENQPLNVIQLLREPSASIVYKGDKEPIMQGWWSGKAHEFTPAAAFCYKLNGRSGTFATLFCYSKNLQSNFSNSYTNDAGNKIHVEWVDNDFSHTLDVTNDKDLKIYYV